MVFCIYLRVRLIMRCISRCIAGSSSVKEARSNSSKSTPLISRSLKHVTTSPIFSSCMFSSLSTRLRSSLTSATFSDFTDRGLAASIFCLIPFQSACLIDACIYVEAGRNETKPKDCQKGNGEWNQCGDSDIPNANANDERTVGGRMVVYEPWLCLWIPTHHGTKENQNMLKSLCEIDANMHAKTQANRENEINIHFHFL